MWCPLCKVDAAQGFMRRFGLVFHHCSNCGIEFIDPQPDDGVLSQIYGKHYYSAWGLDRRHELVRELKLRTFSRRIDLIAAALPSNAKVLDLGCATGFFLDTARDRGFDAFGVELSEFGASVTASRHGSDHVFCGQFSDATFAANTVNLFDAIFMSDFIEHVRDPFAMLKLSCERLVPGGYIVITTPKVGALSYWLMGRSWSQYKPEHLYYFSSKGIKRALECANFAYVEFHPALKRMSLNYIFEVFDAYPHRLFNPLASLAKRILPERLLDVQFLITLGDMVVVARKTV